MMVVEMIFAYKHVATFSFQILAIFTSLPANYETF